VVEARKYDHVNTVFAELHWLPLEARIRYKIDVITFNVVSIKGFRTLSTLVALPLQMCCG